MNLSRAEAQALAEGIAATELPAGVDVAVCPPYVYLEAVAASIQRTTVGLGAQNMYFEGNGAFTGEISAAMLVDIGCKYVILGHSERRNILGECNTQVNKKTLAALAAGLIPIVCVGELLEQREAGQTHAVIQEQFDGSFAGLTTAQMSQVVIAYEPVWAIGTGKVATPQQAQEVHADIRHMLEKRFDKQTAEAVRIQYGGSVKPDNAAELLRQPDIDGALVGGAALKVDSFMGIIRGAVA
jgi:triosephosphate isomerase